MAIAIIIVTFIVTVTVHTVDDHHWLKRCIVIRSIAVNQVEKVFMIILIAITPKT